MTGTRHYMEIKGVEIFAAGTHNGDTYTTDDLDAMVEAYGRLDYTPPLKAGHRADEDGMPAIGWVKNLRRKGEKLVADFKDVPEVLYDAIGKKMFNAVSAEVYWNLKRGAEKFPRALKAVALLGADIPAVAGLKPLYDTLYGGFKQDETTISGAVLKYSTSAPLIVGTADGADGDDRRNVGNAAITNQQERISMFTEEQKAAIDAAVQAAIAEAGKTYDAKLADVTKTYQDDIAKVRKDAEDKVKAAVAAVGKGDNDTLAATLSAITDTEAQRIAKNAQDALARQIKINEADKAARDEAEQRAAKAEAARRTLENEQRVYKIGKISETCRIPALRPFIEQFMDLATRQSGAHVYSEKGEKVTAEQAVANFITTINAQSKTLFQVYSNDDPTAVAESIANGNASGDPEAIGKEVDRLTRKHMMEAQVKDYAAALRAVLDADPTLKAKYNLKYAA